MSLFIVMVPLLKLLLILVHGWIQSVVPVYCYGAIIEIIVDIYSRLGPEAFINTLLFYQLLVSFTLPVPTTNVHRRQWGGGEGVCVGGCYVANVLGWGGVRRLILFQKGH